MTWRGGDGQRGGVAGAESALPEGRALQLVTPAGEAHGPPVDEGGGGGCNGSSNCSRTREEVKKCPERTLLHFDVRDRSDTTSLT